MLLLTSTSDKIQVLTGSAANIESHASWVDNSSGTITPGRTNVVNITTATTTDIVASPGASTQRNVKNLNISNVHATASTQVTVLHTDGTNVVDLMSVTLLAGEELQFGEDGVWRHRDIQGAEYAYNVQGIGNLGITGTLAETMPREICPEVNTTGITSGTLFLQAIYLRAGMLVSNITLCSATTAAGTPTNYFFALYDGNRNLRAQSANQTTTAWAANTVKTLAMTTPYRIPTSGVYYIGFFMTATTQVTLKGGTGKTASQLAGTAPILHGTSSTGLTTVLPDPAAAISVGTNTIYAAVS
jgi:peroxiredoxin family protein